MIAAMIPIIVMMQEMIKAWSAISFMLIFAVSCIKAFTLFIVMVGKNYLPELILLSTQLNFEDLIRFPQ